MKMLALLRGILYRQVSKCIQEASLASIWVQIHTNDDVEHLAKILTKRTGPMLVVMTFDN
jgi:hypothetical protein